MRRLFTAFLLFGLTLAVAPQASASDLSPRQIERLTRQLERLLEPLAGSIDAQDIRLKHHGSDLYSLTYPLKGSDDKPSGLDVRANDDEEEVFRTLACGHVLLEPTTPSAVSTAVVSNLDTHYNLWWAVVNEREQDEERRTTVRITGPEDFVLNVVDDAPYPGESVTLFVFNPEAPFLAPGLYTHRVTVRGGGKVFYRFWVEPLSTTPAE